MMRTGVVSPWSYIGKYPDHEALTEGEEAVVPKWVTIDVPGVDHDLTARTIARHLVHHWLYGVYLDRRGSRRGEAMEAGDIETQTGLGTRLGGATDLGLDIGASLTEHVASEVKGVGAKAKLCEVRDLCWRGSAEHIDGVNPPRTARIAGFGYCNPVLGHLGAPCVDAKRILKLHGRDPEPLRIGIPGRTWVGEIGMVVEVGGAASW